MNEETYAYVIHIGTTADKLFEALTSGDFTKQYWGGRSIESDWKVGSAVRHIKPDGPTDWQGEVLEYDPPSTLSYTFYTPSDAEDAANPSRVRMTIEESGPGTVMLKVVHDRLTDRKLQQISMGWPAILSNLKTLLERGETLNYHWKG